MRFGTEQVDTEVLVDKVPADMQLVVGMLLEAGMLLEGDMLLEVDMLLEAGTLVVDYKLGLHNLQRSLMFVFHLS